MPKKREEREIERWITVRGARVPIFKGQSVEEAIKESVGKRGAGKKQADEKKIAEAHKEQEKSQYGSFKPGTQLTGIDNAREQVQMLKNELKKHPDDTHTQEIKNRLAKAQDRYKKLSKGENSDEEVFKTKKEWGADREKAAAEKENYHLNADQRRAKETTQHAEAKDRYGKDWWGLTDDQRKSIDDQLKKNHPLWYGGKMNSVEKRANEVWDKAQKTAKTDGGENARIGVYKKQLKDVQEDIQQFESTPKSLRSKDYDQKLGELKKKERDLKGWIDNDINTRRNEDIKEKQLAANKVQATQATGRGWAAEHIENDLIRPGGNNADDIRKYIDYNYRIGYISDSEKATLLKKLDSREKAGQTTGKRGSTPEFRDYNEAKEYYQKRFTEMSPQNMNRIARNMQIGGRGKEKIAALAEAKAKEWQKGSAVQEERDKQARHVAERVAQEQAYASMNQRRRELQDQRKADEAYDRHTRKMESFYERTGARPYGEDAFKVQKDLLPSMSAKKLMQEHVKSGGVVKTAIADELQRRGYTPGADGWVKKSSISKESAGAMSNVYDGGKKTATRSTNDDNKRIGSYTMKELKMSDDAYAEHVKQRLVKNGWSENMAAAEAKESVKNRWEDISHFRKQGLIGTFKESASSNGNAVPKKSIPASQVEVSESGYQFAHGKKPRGKGEWAFTMGGEDVFFSGTYAEAKKKAIKEAARRGINRISTGS